MAKSPKNQARRVASVHGRRQVKPDPLFEQNLSRHLREAYAPAALLEHYSRFANGDGELDSLMRRAIWRAVARKFGNGVRIGSGVGFTVSTWKRLKLGLRIHRRPVIYSGTL